MSTKPPYADVEIHLSALQAGGYPLEITLNREQEFAAGLLPGDILPWLSPGSLQAEGQRLVEWLRQSAAFSQAWDYIRGQSAQRRLRLRIDPAASELHALPWETIRERHPEGLVINLAAADSTPFSRYLADSRPPGRPISQRPIKLLVAMANPTDLATSNLAPLDVAAEFARLQEATAGADIELTLLPQPGSLTALANELKQGYHILHFIGHGLFSETKGPALVMANEANQVELVKGERFATMLAHQLADVDISRPDRLRLVFLASCQTANQTAKMNQAVAYRSLAHQVVAAGVPAVIAMPGQMPLPTAQQFSQTFYRQLLSQGQVDLATNQARAHLLTAELTGSAIPVLFMRLRDGVLFAPLPPAHQPIIDRLPFEPETVYIPAGPFIMGTDEGRAYEGPAHEVELPAYRIGNYPVTQGEFAAFIQYTGQVIPALGWPGMQPAAGEEHQPVTGVTWYQAVDYCQWLADKTGRPYRLPTEAEWEKAAQREAEVKQLIGHVREWTCSLWGNHPRQPDTAYRYPTTTADWTEQNPRNDLQANSQLRRIYRGGEGSEATTRRGNLPDTKFNLPKHSFRVIMKLT